MKVRVTGAFVSTSIPDAAIGSVIEVDEPMGLHLIEIGVAVKVDYETKVLAPPENTKKKKQSGSSRQGQAQRRKTRKS